MTILVNPAAVAADTGTSTLVDGFDAGDVAAATGTATIDPTTTTTVARMLPATRFGIGFFTHTRFLEAEPKPDRPRGDSFGFRLASGRKIAEPRGIDAAPETFVGLCDEAPQALVRRASSGRQLLRHTPTVEPPSLGLGGSAPHPIEVGVGQSRLQALLPDRAIPADRQGICHPLLIVREECLSLAFAGAPIPPVSEHSAPRSRPVNHDADTAVHGHIEPYGLTRNNGTTTRAEDEGLTAAGRSSACGFRPGPGTPRCGPVNRVAYRPAPPCQRSAD